MKVSAARKSQSLPRLNSASEGQTEIGIERHGVLRRAVDVREHGIERIAGREILDDFDFEH